MWHSWQTGLRPVVATADVDFEAADYESGESSGLAAGAVVIAAAVVVVVPAGRSSFRRRFALTAEEGANPRGPFRTRSEVEVQAS